MAKLQAVRTTTPKTQEKDRGMQKITSRTKDSDFLRKITIVTRSVIISYLSRKICTVTYNLAKHDAIVIISAAA